jgi:hypothetical protein
MKSGEAHVYRHVHVSYVRLVPIRQSAFELSA